MTRKRASKRFRESGVLERTQLAMQHLATRRGLLRERVVGAYEEHLQFLVPREFPDQETRTHFEAIVDTIEKAEKRIEEAPGAYKLLLDSGQMAPIDVVRATLHYRTADKLAALISDLYLTFVRGLVQEYQREIDELTR